MLDQLNSCLHQLIKSHSIAIIKVLHAPSWYLVLALHHVGRILPSYHTQHPGD